MGRKADLFSFKTMIRVQKGLKIIKIKLSSEETKWSGKGARTCFFIANILILK